MALFSSACIAGRACAAETAVRMATSRTFKVAAAQMTSTSDLHSNFLTCSGLVQEAASAGVKFLSLPECFSFMGSREGETLSIAEPLDGPILQRYQELARKAGMWLSLGGFQEKCPDGLRLFNSHVLLDDLGTIQSCYRKIHLFDVDVPGGPVLQESKSTAPGSEVVVASSPIGRLGLTVCYDLRFPELYQELRFKKDAEVLLVPSAFTKVTGAAHWEILLRARAVETQCYVIAAAQTGKHNEKRESYGDAMIVDPWGTVIGRCTDRLCTGLAMAEVDLDFLSLVRKRMPISEHRRYDIYGCMDSAPSKGGVPYDMPSSL